MSKLFKQTLFPSSYSMIAGSKRVAFSGGLKMEQVYEAIELANKTGAVKRGVNEATKAAERSKAKLVAYAADVSPKEIVMHLPLLCKEKGIPCFEVGSKEELGAASGLPRSTGAVAITKEGEAKKVLKELAGLKEEKKGE